MADYELAEDYVLSDLRSRVEEALFDIKRTLFEDFSRLEGRTEGWIDSMAKKIAELEKRIEELEAEMDKLQEQRYNTDEELRNRITRLETLSFIGSLTKLMNKAQKAGVEPTQLFEEALRILEKSLKGRSG